METGKILRNVRKAYGISTEDVAKMMPLTQTTLFARERDEREWKRVDARRYLSCLRIINRERDTKIKCLSRGSEALTMGRMRDLRREVSISADKLASAANWATSYVRTLEFNHAKTPEPGIASTYLRALRAAFDNREIDAQELHSAAEKHVSTLPN